jgi:hypothetical protein
MRHFLLIFILLCGFLAAAQNKGANSSTSKTNSNTPKTIKKDPLDRIHIGGTLNGGFSNDYYFLTLAPKVSMDVTKWFVPGVSLAYMYAQESGANRVTTNTYGAGVFTDFYPVKYVFGHVEYQHLWYNQKVKGDGGSQKNTFDDNFLLMGVGAKVPIGTKMSAMASVLFNVLNNENSEYYMYKNPIYSIGIEAGL